MRTWKTALHTLSRPLYRGWETNHDLRNTVFLAGSGRSGTTWISEIINADGSFRYVFEPFSCRKTIEWRTFEFQQYFPRTYHDAEALEAATRILSGRVHNAWVDSQNRTILARRRLVKDIRTNLMLGWLKENFPAMPMVLLVREPLAVVASRRRLGWGPTMGLERIRRMPRLIEDHIGPWMGFIEANANDEFAMQVINWCIEHLVPLRQLREGEYRLLRYEQVLADPEAQVGALFDYLGLCLSGRHLARLRRPSATASSVMRRGNAVAGSAVPQSRPYSTDQQLRAQEIVDRFGLGSLVARS
jgi:hypothetical protein